MRSAPAGRRLVIVSNRLPVVAELAEGRWRLEPGGGGLVTALAPLLRDRGGVWIGWPGTTAPPDADLRRLLRASSRTTGYQLEPVFLDDRERHLYYQSFANEIVWPVFHDLPSHCRLPTEAWQVYEDVNARFAGSVAACVGPDDFIWIHDYHLMLAARQLRRRGLTNRTAFFLHIPFPAPDNFLKMPRRYQLLSDLLAYDLIGFQASRDCRNFIQCVRMLLGTEAHIVRQRNRVSITHQHGTTCAGAFPIGIDFASFERDAGSDPVARRSRYIRGKFAGRQIALGIDRLDYTKGLPDKLRAFREALRRWPEMHGRITLIQVVVPSRSDIGGYGDLKEELNRQIGEINGEFTRPGWVPVHYLYRSLDRLELLAYYRTADIMLVTPLKDGMNLVAKEYVAANHDRNGVLVLSEFAGAIGQLQHWSLNVNPHDAEHVAAAIHDAWLMPLAERRRRLTFLRQAVRRQDVFWWIDTFLRAARNQGLDDFPRLEEYVPRRRRPRLEASP